MPDEVINLSTPLILCGKTVKNRIVVPPMADFGMTESDGLVNIHHRKRYEEYAMGGAGLIIIEACAVTDVTEPRNTIGLFDDSCLPGLNELAKAAKKNGAIALAQIMHTGLKTLPEETIAQIDREVFLRYKQDFISAAIRCKKAGFDGVDIHAAHGMYLNEIVETSTRDDEYGGCFENRVRILREVIEEIKSACSANFIVAVRFGNPNYQELLQTAQVIEQAGGDLLDVSTGRSSYRDVPADFPYDAKIYAASLVKAKAHLPVIGVGGITSGEQAEEVLKHGYADMVAVGRGHLCDPAWGRKALGRETPILCRQCRACMWYVDGRKCPAVLERNRIAQREGAV